MRPRFSVRVGIACRAASWALQRVITDFGADEAFGRVPAKLKEHYGIEMPVSTIQRITERHAQRCYEQETRRELAETPSEPGEFVGEMDGCMVPVVETVPEGEDRRRGKRLMWKEVRLCLVHPAGSATPRFGGHFAGGVEESGRQWARCAQGVGFGADSHLHAVGDGAPWIAEQVEVQFGAQASYLVDFYHLCEYLGEASRVCAANQPEVWMEEQKSRLKRNETAAVLAALAPCREAAGDGPVTACERYIRNRLDQLDYRGALERQFPIGSGEIESAHRYVIQDRLKLPGAWWKPDHVEAMLALRIKRANREWDFLWPIPQRQAA